MHLRNSRTRWIALASTLGGLAIAFEIDTGLYLTVALILYATFRLSGRPRSNSGGRDARRALACFLSFFAPLLIFLSLASRGTLHRVDFWRGIIERLVEFSGGLFALPMATEPYTVVLIYFFLSVSLFLFLVARMFIPPEDEDLKRRDLFWGIWGAYGLAFLILFVYRSHSWNFYHASVPFAVAAAHVGASAAASAGQAIPRLGRRTPWRLVPVSMGYAALAFSLIFLLKSPCIRSYPS